MIGSPYLNTYKLAPDRDANGRAGQLNYAIVSTFEQTGKAIDAFFRQHPECERQLRFSPTKDDTGIAHVASYTYRYFGLRYFELDPYSPRTHADHTFKALERIMIPAINALLAHVERVPGLTKQAKYILRFTRAKSETFAGHDPSKLISIQEARFKIRDWNEELKRSCVRPYSFVPLDREDVVKMHDELPPSVAEMFFKVTHDGEAAQSHCALLRDLIIFLSDPHYSGNAWRQMQQAFEDRDTETYDDIATTTAINFVKYERLVNHLVLPEPKQCEECTRCKSHIRCHVAFPPTLPPFTKFIRDMCSPVWWLPREKGRRAE